MQHDGRLDPAYGFERDPGVGHATCRETPRLAGSRSDFHPSKYSTNGLDSPQRKQSSHVKFRVVLRIVCLWMLHSANNETSTLQLLQ